MEEAIIGSAERDWESGVEQLELSPAPARRTVMTALAEHTVHLDRGLAGAVLLGIATLYVILAVGPLLACSSMPRRIAC